MKKTIILAVLLLPTFTYAVWWNPSTWGQKATIYEAVSTPVVTPEPQIIETIVEVPVEKEVVKEVIKEVPKVVEKVVTVQDQTVLAKNKELTDRVAQLEKEIKALKSELSKYKNINSELESIADNKQEIKDLKLKLVELEQFKADLLKDDSDKKYLLDKVHSITDSTGKTIFQMNDFDNILKYTKDGVTRLSTLPDKTLLINKLNTYIRDTKNQLYILE